MGTTTFNIIDGGLGGQAPGKDYYAGLVFFPATTPTGFAVNDKIKRVFALSEAEGLGITEALYPLEHYHISEFFRGVRYGLGNENPVLYIYIADPTPTAEVFDGSQITALSDFDPDIRQIGVYTGETFATSLITTAGAANAVLLSENRPVTVLLAADFSAVTDLTTLADIRAVNKKGVGVVIAQDGSGKGKTLFDTLGASVTSLGLTLGIASGTDVASNIGQVSAFNLTNGDDYRLAAYANGDLVRDTIKTTQNYVNTSGYITVTGLINRDGVYHTDSPLAVAITSDFAYIENDRVINKAIRVIDAALFNFRNAKALINASTGQLQESYALRIEAACKKPLETMAKNEEISFDEQTGNIPPGSVLVDRISNVLSTGIVNLTVKIVPVGISRSFTVNIGFTTKI